MKKNKIAYVINIIIFVLVFISGTMMFSGFKFDTSEEPILEVTKLGMFKFFTVDANLLMGLTSLIFARKYHNIFKGKIKEIDKKYYILKLVSTTAIGLTFTVVFGYFAIAYPGGVVSMIRNSNLFFHLIIPVLSIATFIFLEKTDKIRFKDVVYCLIPTIVYGYFYLFSILLHMNKGKVSYIYDFYFFVQKGVWMAIIVVPFIFLMTYLIGIILWKLNKKH